MTMTDWPCRGTTPLGITEFTVFGKAASTPMHGRGNRKMMRTGPTYMRMRPILLSALVALLLTGGSAFGAPG
jgi:hypothetical protein